MGSKRAASAYSNTVSGQTPGNEAIFTFSTHNCWHYEHYVLDSETQFIQKSCNGDRSNNSKMKPTAELKGQREEAGTLQCVPDFLFILLSFCFFLSFQNTPTATWTNRRKTRDSRIYVWFLHYPDCAANIWWQCKVTQIPLDSKRVKYKEKFKKS